MLHMRWDMGRYLTCTWMMYFISENKLGITSKARGWEGGMPQFYRKDGDRGAYGEDEEGDWEDEGDWEEDGEGVEGGMAPTLLDVEREALEKQFEKLWGDMTALPELELWPGRRGCQHSCSVHPRRRAGALAPPS